MIRSVENISQALRSLYRKSGYMRYKMSKFEEYDFYVRNKDFLISDSVITFTDTNGKLMALKPDVTLSIVKNSRSAPGCVQKMYYNENVYRISGGVRSFREIVQLGLECIGDVDDYCIFEVLLLAAQSLKSISPDSMLGISHLGLWSWMLSGISDEQSAQILRCIRDRNRHELIKTCEAVGIGERIPQLVRLLECHGKPQDVFSAAEAITGPCEPLAQLRRLTEAFAGSGLEDMLRIDFSVVNDMKYYNGIVFKGFVEGIPQDVLSGGQYDRLMQKMQRSCRAIGFAVYTDLLERLYTVHGEYDADVLLLYDESSDIRAVSSAAQALQKEGKRVMVQRSIPEKLRFRQMARYQNGEVKLCENA